MKKKTVNTITTIIGWMLILAIIPAVFVIGQGLGVIIPALFLCGLGAIYLKNDDAIALAQNWLNKFK